MSYDVSDLEKFPVSQKLMLFFFIFIYFYYYYPEYDLSFFDFSGV